MEYWNHNTAYYKWIKKQVIHCSRILDVGCGDGSLIGLLDDCNKHLTGIDSYEPCIKKAKSQLISKCKEIHSCEDENIPVSYEFLAMDEIRNIKNVIIG